MTVSGNVTRAVLSVTVQVHNDVPELELLAAVTDLMQQDRTLSVEVNSKCTDFTIFGQNETQLEMAYERIRDHFNFQITVGAPQILYLETIRSYAEAEGKYIRQTGGLGNYGHCKILLMPGPQGSGYQFFNEIRNGAIPGKFIESIDLGIRESLNGGILASYPVVDIVATLVDGSHHPADSNDIAFRIAGAMAFKEAARKANPVLLEPLMTVCETVKEQHMGSIIADLSNRRARIESVERRKGAQILTALVPLAEMLTTSEQGRADYPMHFARYEPVPPRKDRGDGTVGIPVLKPRPPVICRRSAAVTPVLQSDLQSNLQSDLQSDLQQDSVSKLFA